MTAVFFKFLSQNIQMKYLCSQISNFLVLHETMHLGRFENPYFKYDDSLLKLLPKTPK